MGVIVDIIHNRTQKKNQNVICLVVGSTGSGKSYACMNFAEHIDPQFNQDKIVFSVDEFVNLIDNSKKYKLKKGSCIVFEEVGVAADARNFQSKINKILTYILETFRTDNIVLFINVPNQNFIDKKIRELSHAIIDMTWVDKPKKKSSGRFRWIQVDGVSGKVYYKYTRAKKNGRAVMVKNVIFTLPNEDLVNQYENKRSKFLKKVKQDARNQIDEDKASEVYKMRRKMNPQQHVDHMLAQPGMTYESIYHSCANSRNPSILATSKIAGFFGVHPGKASAISSILISEFKKRKIIIGS